MQKILISDFRNIKSAELNFVEGINCICGDNGQGKTNLLDAIWYLSMTKSASGAADQLCARYGCQSFSIAGTFAMSDGRTSKFTAAIGPNGKVFKRDDKAYSRLSAHIGILPVVMVSPQDSALVSESGEERRRFVNSVLCQMDNAYLAASQKYNRLLAERNRMLKEAHPDAALMEVLELQMAPAAHYIRQQRREFAEKLEKAVAVHYEALSGGLESVGIRYRADSEDDYADVFCRSRERDMMLHYTGNGVQRDDFIFTMNGHPIRRSGSQGQQKSFLVAMKLAQYDIMREAYGFAPLLLLDDVFDKLDTKRISNLIKRVSENGYGQIFISDTNRARMEEIVGGIAPDTLFINAENGEFQTC